MGQIIFQNGPYALSTLRTNLRCNLVGGYDTASQIRVGFTLAGPGAMSFAIGNWLNTACWRLTVIQGDGTVAVTNPWYSGYAYNHPNPQPRAVSANQYTWVTINASPSVDYSFSYWMRQDPYEVWSYSSQTDYYVPTDGWQNTTYIAAGFNYTPPPPPAAPCNQYYIDFGWAGVDCQGLDVGGYSYGENICLQSLAYGGYITGAECSPGCPVKGTSIEMADGTTKLIEKIRVGDVLKGMKINDAPEDDTIVGWSTNDLNLIETEVIVRGIQPIYATGVYNFNNGLIETSEDHAHFIKRGDAWSFIQSKNIQVGDFLVDKDSTSIEITSIDVLQGEDRKVVYNMNVENTDTYIANGLVTHNNIGKIQ